MASGGRVADMMGRTHALSGLVTGVAMGQFGWHLDPAHVAVAAAVTAGAAVLPDIDHPDASVADSFGFVTKGFAWLIEHVSGGHRHGTHSLAGIAAFTGTAYLAERHLQTLAGKIGLGLLLVLVLASGLRALKIGGHVGDVLAIGAAVAMLRTGYGVTSVPLAVAAGTATHLVGDMLTNEGIPIAWPLSRVHFRLLPEPLAFTTGTRPERWVVAPLMLAALAWLVAVVEKILPAGRLPLH
jgi:membrane-bound metal-dependent hydrolase YbcI (DUF457 family)